MKKFWIAGVLIAAVAVGWFMDGKGLPWLQGTRFSGTLEMTEYNLGSPVPGRLESVAVREGDNVTKGQLLAVFDRYAQAKRDLDRTKDLHRQGGASDQELERAELAFQDQAVVSPVDGVVLVKSREAGEVVAAGSPVLVVGSNKDLWVKIFIPEGEISRIRVGTSATVKFDGLKEKFPAHVTYVSPQSEFTPRNVQTHEERVTVTFAVKVTLDSPSTDLRPGIFGDVVLDLK